MPDFREECCSALQPFTSAYGQLCDDLDLPASKQLYESILERLIKEIPEQSVRRPYKLSEKKIIAILNSVCKSNDRSTKEAAALSLHRLISLLKQQSLIDGKVMITRRLRPEELAIHDSNAFALLDDFIEIRQWLCNRIQKVPRSRRDLPQLVMASLIAVNGICGPNAHLRISSCRPNHLRDASEYPTLDVPTSRFLSKNPPTTRFPILPEIGNLLRHLKGTDQWLFPKSFTPEAWGHKKKRTQIINAWLITLWENVIGKDRKIPASWNICTFITCSRLYMALNSSPVVTGYLSGRTAFASFEVATDHQSGNTITVQNDRGGQFSETTAVEIDTLLARELIHAVRHHLNQYNHKVQSKGVKEKAAFRLLAISAVYHDLLHRLPCLKHLIDWMIHELNSDGKRRKMGTLRSFWYHIPMPLVDELVGSNPVDFDEEQWLKLAEYLIQENNHSPATRSKIKQHLKAFHNYLSKSQDGVAPINWRRGELTVYTEAGRGMFPTLSEFDLLYEEAAKESSLQTRAVLQGALVLAFFGGLRAEEITLLSKMDLDELTLQVRVWWSKTRQGRRRLPLFLLTPKKYLAPVKYLLRECSSSQRLIFQDQNGDQISPDALGKRIKKLINNVLPVDRTMSIHTLRHGFASWLLIRYFALHEPGLLEAIHSNGAPIIPDASHEVFSKAEQKKLVRVFNGRLAGEQFESNPESFLSKPEHFAYISKLIGHATRDTTARTYVHSMEWIAMYYIKKGSRLAG